MASCRVHQLINTRQRITILGTCFVQVSEIYAHSPFATCFLHHHHIGQLIQVIDFLNELRRGQFLKLFLDCLISLRSEYPLLLVNRLKKGVHVQSMSDYTWIDSQHVIMTPCKHVNTLSQELDEVFSCLLLYTCSNSSEFLEIIFL